MTKTSLMQPGTAGRVAAETASLRPALSHADKAVTNNTALATENPATNAPRPAIFLDRDGVLNRNIFYNDTKAWESPRHAAELELTPGAAQALVTLRQAGYLLILVSNQPNAAKGKCTPATLTQIHQRLIDLLADEGAWLDDALYCHHHPAHTGPCACRKPNPFFLLHSASKFNISLSRSWMIGDRPTDITCGQSAGVRTIWIDNGEGVKPPASSADLTAMSLPEAASILLGSAEQHTPQSMR